MYLNEEEKKRKGRERWQQRKRERRAVKWRVGQHLRESTASLHQQFKRVLD